MISQVLPWRSGVSVRFKTHFGQWDIENQQAWNGTLKSTPGSVFCHGTGNHVSTVMNLTKPTSSALWRETPWISPLTIHTLCGHPALSSPAFQPSQERHQHKPDPGNCKSLSYTTKSTCFHQQQCRQLPMVKVHDVQNLSCFERKGGKKGYRDLNLGQSCEQTMKNSRKHWMKSWSWYQNIK